MSISAYDKHTPSSDKYPPDHLVRISVTVENKHVHSMENAITATLELLEADVPIPLCTDYKPDTTWQECCKDMP